MNERELVILDNLLANNSIDTLAEYLYMNYPKLALDLVDKVEGLSYLDSTEHINQSRTEVVNNEFRYTI